MLFRSVVRETMTRLGLITNSYKYKVLSLDPQGRQYLIMIDLKQEVQSQFRLIAQIESLLTQEAKARHDITVTGIYWRFNENKMPLENEALSPDTGSKTVAPPTHAKHAQVEATDPAQMRRPGQDAGAARTRAGFGLEHEHRRPLAQHDAGAQRLEVRRHETAHRQARDPHLDPTAGCRPAPGRCATTGSRAREWKACETERSRHATPLAVSLSLANVTDPVLAGPTTIVLSTAAAPLLTVTEKRVGAWPKAGATRASAVSASCTPGLTLSLRSSGDRKSVV